MGEKKPPKKPPGYPNIDPTLATDYAKNSLGNTNRSNWCAQWVQESLLGGKSGNYDNATQWYNESAKKNWLKTTAPPAGVPVFYAGNATTGDGHVAISAGNGFVYTTDATGTGTATGKVRYDKLWGGTGSGKYLGWTGNVRTNRDGGYAHVNYNPKTGDQTSSAENYTTPKTGVNSGKVKVTPSPKPGAAPKAPRLSSSSNAASPSPSEDGSVAGNVNLQSIHNPNISKQFSGVTQGNIPLVG